MGSYFYFLDYIFLPFLFSLSSFPFLFPSYFNFPPFSRKKSIRNQYTKLTESKYVSLQMHLSHATEPWSLVIGKIFEVLSSSLLCSVPQQVIFRLVLLGTVLSPLLDSSLIFAKLTQLGPQPASYLFATTGQNSTLFSHMKYSNYLFLHRASL